MWHKLTREIICLLWRRRALEKQRVRVYVLECEEKVNEVHESMNTKVLVEVILRKK